MGKTGDAWVHTLWQPVRNRGLQEELPGRQTASTLPFKTCTIRYTSWMPMVLTATLYLIFAVILSGSRMERASCVQDVPSCSALIRQRVDRVP